MNKNNKYYGNNGARVTKQRPFVLPKETTKISDMYGLGFTIEKGKFCMAVTERQGTDAAVINVLTGEEVLDLYEKITGKKIERSNYL